ncbi:nitrogen regulatory protein P-II [Desulfarculus baarsii DSM 2075]|uniref:Nitrogen regulatory protein P-II n=1 Tax=Desulfarculus baarsii (strain ATCC 33931 / DSM 2075 / LMG 7858 / VKM B-1802 / 2st14) TaxID=644282 RepID=E1QE28_DESB2|nr:P-II family nitrogen regulator [Desulfarculus baarsii]ADK83814.1 nitrogen regulatory protein P-II [Desulfarculus baarsii DSM 2075]
MKEVIAVVRMNTMNKTKKALTAAGIDSMFAHECQGRGKGLVDSKLLSGASQGYEEAIALLGEKGKLYSKRMLTMVVPDKQVDAVVRTIIESNQTGKPGDGKIFVLPIGEAIRVRTGETGGKAL